MICAGFGKFSVLCDGRGDMIWHGFKNISISDYATDILICFYFYKDGDARQRLCARCSFRYWHGNILVVRELCRKDRPVCNVHGARLLHRQGVSRNYSLLSDKLTQASVCCVLTLWWGIFILLWGKHLEQQPNVIVSNEVNSIAHW